MYGADRVATLKLDVNLCGIARWFGAIVFAESFSGSIHRSR